MESNREFYDFLCQLYMKSTLESRLMLDEDMEVILNDYSGDLWCEHYYKPSILFTVGGLASVFTTYLSKRIDVPFLFVPSLVISSFTVLYEVKDVLRKKRQKNNIADLMEHFNLVRKLNNSITKYITIRHDIKAINSDLLFKPITPMIENFVRYVYKMLIEVLRKIRRHLIEYSKIESSLNDDVSIIYDIDLEPDLEENFDSKYCLDMLQRLQAIYILFVSKFLSYTCIVLYKNTKNYKLKQRIFNVVVPGILKDLQNCYSNLKQNFDSVKFYNEKKQRLNQIERPRPKQSVVGKVQKTLTYSATNLSIIMEKSEVLLKKVEEMNDDNELSEIGPLIVDLKDHTHATYESLDTLCRFYQVFANSRTDFKQNLEFPKQYVENDVHLRSVAYDDEIEACEERYKLDMRAIDEEEQETYVCVNDAQYSPYMGLVIKEMKESLLHHQRFIDAKNRRGSGDSSNDESDEKPRQLTRKEKQDIERLEAAQFQIPNFITMNSDGDMTSVLDSIKVLSKQMDRKEEVFGDADDDDDEIEY